MPDTGAEVYSGLIQSLFDAELARKSTLEQKGSAVITTSGTLVTLLFGLVAVVTGAAHFSLPRSSHPWLIAAVVAFSLSALLAILVALPRPYGETEVTADQLRDWWADSLPDAEFAVAALQLRRIETARRRNGTKVGLLLAAMFCQLIGLAMLTIAVALVLT